MFSPSGSHTILVFSIRGGNILKGTPANGASNAGGVGKKTRFWTNIWLRCVQVCQPYESRTVKN